MAQFSILLPTRNRPELLRLSIASALAQTEPDFELLVVGDGCTDATRAVIATFSDPRLRWFDLPKAFGFGYANRNVALKQSTGEYIAFVGDDDLLLPDHLARMREALDEARAEWGYSRPLWVTSDGVVIPFPSNLLNADELQTFLATGNHIPATCVMYRRSCLEAYGFWPEDVPRAGDWRYWIRIIEGAGRRGIARATVPTTLHFNAEWKSASDQMGQVVAAHEIAAAASWWPDSMRIPVMAGVTEQQTFAPLLRDDAYVARLRMDVSTVVDRLAWIQLSDTPGLLTRERAARLEEVTQLKADLARAADALEETRHRLTAALDAATSRLNDVERQLQVVLSSRSWRVTAPLRALTRAFTRGGR